jgi:2-iminobutanoate/2-iminopropanoate deaminase
MSEIRRKPTPFSYSSAVAAGNFVFLGLHRGFGDRFSDQFDSAFAAMNTSLEEFNFEIADLIKVNVWLRDISDLPEMEKRFADYFEKDHFPARMTSTTEFIDEDCMMMIEGVAFKGT